MKSFRLSEGNYTNQKFNAVARRATTFVASIVFAVSAQSTWAACAAINFGSRTRGEFQ
jgi:hypothetical protein